ncbi:NADH dehydrogenase subunit E [Dissulfurispira thermophila]|uniref:NADH dehydrogenase subunit E n=2 Tax=root TaxID=1 RepID=A0A7G1H535_9BACT|nr:NADH-quinone oxidoreductase subunit NuoE [Dissulfurispira thermophila]BCB97026.1 NADH dehydrogenase subunit E [Dissulfurispira thermophila]
MLSERVVNEINQIQKRYLDARACLLPALYVVQREHGWISPDALEAVGDLLNVPKATVKGVSTFYSMFRHRPIGRHVIQLCTNVACMIMGAERLVDILRSRYGIEPNSTTDDGRFSLVIMECIGACGTAPAMLVDSDFYDNLTEENVIEILERYK